MVTAKELRARARSQMGNNIFSNKWLLLLVGCFVMDAILGLSGFTAILVFILSGPIMIGQAYACLKQVRDNSQPVLAKDYVFGVLDNRFSQSILVGLLNALFVFFWSLLFVIPGIVKSYAYALAPYIAIDHPEMEANAVITESRRLMVGHKFRLFCLDLSFIGWYFVGALCFGLGVFWVAPYHQLARANFYEDLVGSPAIA
ncbi:MAG: DUF975 family protein [Clostridia bacterium]|nr:DUF975 family protein [Clostridia bacterium]